MNSILFLFALTVSVVYSQVPTPCVTPPQWEARYFSYDEARQDVIRALLTYDSIYKRERIIDEFTLNQQDDFFDSLYLHNQNIEYRYNFKTKQCTKQALTRPWRDIGVPVNATSLGESYIGSSAVPNANLLTTIWGDKFTDEKGNQWETLGTWSYEACLPIHFTAYSKGANVNYHASYYDITPGISNPEAFIPRKECLSL